MSRSRILAAPRSPSDATRRSPVPAAPPRGALVVGSVLLVAVVMTGLALLGEGRPVFQGIDDRWMRSMQGSPDGVAARFARALDMLGGPLGVILPIALTGCLGIYGRWRSAVFVFTAGVVSNIVLVLPLKQLVDRPRPPWPWVLVSEGSFPSGQVFTVTTLVLTAGVVLFPPRARRWWWLFGAILVAATMWSRTWLHAQWLSDTVAGAAAGVGAVLLLWSAFAPLLKEEAARVASGRLWD
ncbi:phosphatase PAP2 family protein [Streptomyces sp. ISL-22]|uniref:phosphatase PAP2 family protein n=1 Tax=unclassified Streptomyces TaxID=2593676 RepID=UPI001BEA85F4|nr:MULTISPECIES: phosphatase PAP2 family protein [unclassified Streptomyces]MBT2422477.1 phosphatase PAP2 family protein [Streptomyces sp. ISL-24]MBT2436528.1 phosphatase PAP2 family protein [Streptomyces sp. ISL-22]